jgi:phosphoserine phosphatase RsbU/P
MLNLQMLREERIRTRQQQERLIRRQLKLLAESLDESSRVEILKALEPEAEGRTSSDNDLAELARILGQMSGLVTTQQDRLVGLLKELRSAMEQQAILVTLQQELEIARSMQLSILPRQAPATDAVRVAALMIPAKEVGGDFYDYFLIDDDHLALVVADVSGKGIPAAFFMAISRTLLKSNALYVREPAQVVARLNDQLCAENEQMMFVTVFFGVLRLSTGEMSYVNAGHNPPLIGSRLRGVDMLPKGQNMALAVMDELSYITGQVTLAKGDTLLLYTDGVTEATNRAGELFGEARLVDIVGALHDAGDDLPQAVLRAVREFENGAAQADDITCVAVRYGVVG